MNSLVVRNMDAMVDEAVAALDAGGTTKFPLVDGRIVAVFATPDDASSQKMAMGISVLPSGYSTPAHHHPAEEFAMIVSGTGSITIDGEIVPVGPGDVVVTPPDSVHVTTSLGDDRLVIYWTYGPAGSEQRWLPQEKEKPKRVSMERTGISSNRSWSDVAYSRAVRVGDLIEVAGTTSSGPGGEILHAGDMYLQASEICGIIKRSVEELGGSLDDVVRTRVFITDISQWEAAGRAHFEAFGHMDHPPASAFYGINELLHPDLLLEIEATAIVGAGA